MKRFIALISAIALSLSFAAFAVSAENENITYVVNGMNSYRDVDMLIVYNTAGTTGTNEWGYEVTVGKNGKVTSVGGNNNKIPEGGFVLSGHGKAATFLAENISVGDKVAFLEESMIVSIGNGVPSPFYSVEVAMNGMNVYRATDYVVVYTNSGSKTGTNAYGFEVVVENGVVTHCGGNDSPIPNDGYVISGNGAGANALKSAVVVGMSVRYDAGNKKITFSYDADAMIRSDAVRLDKATALFENAVNSFYLIDKNTVATVVDKATSLFDTMKTGYTESGSEQQYLEARTELLSLLDTITDGSAESRPVEYRAMWIEPSDKTPEQVHKTVKSAHDSGINTICLETLFNATMIYPTPEGSLFRQNPALHGFDLLAAYIDECHKLGMELHAWITVYYVGNKDGKNASLSVFNQKPEWRITDNNGGCYGDSVAMFLNPANPEVSDFLIESYRYILENYDIDGLQLDYVRYPHNGTDTDYGYDDATLSAFESKYGIMPEYKPSESYWKDWCAFRASYVTDFVRRVRSLIDEVAPDVMLSADVYGNMDNAMGAVYQNGKAWIEEGLLDIVFPMTYGETEEMKAFANRYLSLGRKNVMAVPGLGIYIASQNADTMREQLMSAREMGSDGYSFFELEAFNTKNVGEKLKNSAFAQNALPPFLNVSASIHTYADFMSKRVNDIMLPSGAISENEANALLIILGKLKNNALSDEDMTSLSEAIAKISDSNAKEALESDMKLMNRLAVHYTDETPADTSDSASEAASDNESDTATAVSDPSAAETDTSRGKLVIAAVVAVDLIIVTIVAAFMSKKRFGKKNGKKNK